MRAFILAVTGLAIGVTACGSYDGSKTIEVQTPAGVAAVSITLPSPSLVAGQTQRANVVVRDANGVALANRPVQWFSSSASVATVSDSGLIAAVAPGTATVSAVSDGVSGQAAMTVMPPPPAAVAQISVSITPSAIVVGQTAHASAALQDSSGNPLTGRAVTWVSTNPSAATVSATGDISAVAPGTTAIRATSESKTASASLTVSAPAPIPVATVSVSPTSQTLQIGATVQLSAVTRDANNNVLTGRAISWTSGNTGIATVSGSGLVTAVSAGSVTITASSEGRIASATVTVSAPAPVPVASVTVSPSSASLLVGATQQLSAVTRDASNNVLTGRVVTWISSNPSISTVSGSGLVTAVAAGSATITATSETKTGTSAITVSAPAPVPVASVTVSPSSASLLVGATQQLSAVTRDANNNVLTGRAISWTSTNTAVATVSGSGLVTAVTAGSATVRATSEGQTGSSAVTVNAAAPVPVATVTVSPTSASLQVGSTQQLSAVTRDVNNNVLTGRVVTWSSANTAVATVNSNGVVSAVSAGGPVQITATSETKTGTSSITVTTPPPPPPPGGGAGWRGKEPAGLTALTDQPFNSLPSDGWTGWFNYDLTSDATGPQSPGEAFENLYPAGMAGGINPGLAEYDFSNKKTLYVSMYVKHSANFQGHSSTVNKIIHIWVGSLNHLFLNAAGTGNGSLVGQIRLQGIAGGGNFDGGTAGIYDNGVNMARDQWHLLEVIAVANTGSNKDGSVSLYVDGVLAASCSGIEFEGGGPSWNLVKIDPTWGGTGDRVNAAMSIRVDHIYISGN